MPPISEAFSIFAIALRLGLTSFGGPVAHLGFFRAEYVDRRAWLTEREFADLVALCQFLPGPASSQTGFAIGCKRGGLAGGIAAFLGFTLPSMIVMIGFAYGLAATTDLQAVGWVRGMKAAAVAVVGHAVVQMAGSLCTRRMHWAIAFGACAMLLHTSAPWLQLVAIALGAGLGVLTLGSSARGNEIAAPQRVNVVPRVVALAAFGGLLVGLPMWAAAQDAAAIAYLDSYYRSGALVFGGGHVVLPLLETEFVGTGVVSKDTFLAGYGAAQAVPGPLFTFASFLGAAAQSPPNGVLGGLLGTAAIFLPSLLLLYGLLPFWDRLRAAPTARAALAGTNAAVVGLLLAALYDPVWTSGVTEARSFTVALGCYLLLTKWRFPAWAVVLIAAGAGAGLL